MDIFKLLRNWFNWAYENPELIKPTHTALYVFIIEHNNRLGWKEKFGLPTEMAKDAIGIKSYKTYKNTLEDLVQFGFIKMVEVSKNQYSSNIIAMVNITKANAKALDKATSKHASKQCQSTYQSIDSIDIQSTNNKIQSTDDVVTDTNTNEDLKKVDIHPNLLEAKITTDEIADNGCAQPVTAMGVEQPQGVPISEMSIKAMFVKFITTMSEQKNLMAKNNGLTHRQVDICCIGFVNSLITAGAEASSIKPDFNRHFREWFNKWGKFNVSAVPKGQIDAEFKHYKLYEYAEQVEG